MSRNSHDRGAFLPSSGRPPFLDCPNGSFLLQLAPPARLDSHPIATLMAERLLLFETDDCNRVGPARVVDQNLVGPEFVDGWQDVLDARHPPYTDQSVEELCDYASHVRKPYVLVDASNLESDER